jgi:hypothetical protein
MGGLCPMHPSFTFTKEKFMKLAAQVVGGILAFFIVVTFIGFLSMGSDFFLYKFFAPKQEAIRTQVYRESQAHIDGVINDLQKLQVEYASADAQGKLIIEDVVIQKSATFTGPMPDSLTGFVAKIKAKKGL